LKEELENKQFRITVIGEFSSGKSTFLNALIGKDLLPHGVRETTATLNYIHNVPVGHELEGLVRVNFTKNDKHPLEINLLESSDALKLFSTKHSEKLDVAQEVGSIDIYTNFSEIDQNVIFVDTPGLNGTALGHREITMQEIERAHTSIFLLHIRGLSESVSELLKIVFKHQKSVVFVINFADELKKSEGECLESLKMELEERLKNLDGDFKIEEIKIFALSSLKALVAKEHKIKKLYMGDSAEINDSQRLLCWKESGFEEFESYFFNDVIGEKRNRIFYESINNKFKVCLEELLNSINYSLSILESSAENSDAEEFEKINEWEIEFEKEWEKVRNYIYAKKFELKKEFKVILEKDFSEIEDFLYKEIDKETYESIHDPRINLKYIGFLQNEVIERKNKYKNHLNKSIKYIQDISLLKIYVNKNYSNLSQRAEIYIENICGDLEPHLSKLGLNEKAKLEKEKNKHEDEIQKYKYSQTEMESKIKRFESEYEEIERRIKEQIRKIDSIGERPKIKKIKREKDVLVYERSLFNPVSWFRGRNVMEKKVFFEEDSSELVKWREEKTKKEREMYYLKEEKEEIEGKIKMFRQHKTAAQQNIELEKRRLENIDLSIKHQRDEFEQFKVRKSEVLEKKKTEARDKLGKLINVSCSGEVYIDTLDSVFKAIDENIIKLEKFVRGYYEKEVREKKNELELKKSKKEENLLRLQEDRNSWKELVSFLEGLIFRVSNYKGV
jgi:GTPase Era involved in 16S rRNA processing